MATISHIDHFVLTVRSLEATCGFYERILGLRRVDTPGKPTALAFGKQKINLHEVGRTFEPKAAALMTPENRALIGKLKLALEPVSPWTAETTEAAMRAFAEAGNLKLGAVAQPLRVALTGRTTSPGIFDVLAVLGREECLARLGDQTPA